VPHLNPPPMLPAAPHPWTGAAPSTSPPHSPPASPTPTGPPGNGHDSGGLIGLLLLGAVLWTAGYAVSIRLHPFKVCRRCEGTGKHRGAWFTNAYRACDRCGGTGRERRLFATDPYKQNPDKRRRQE
jgi:hypothetical protein